MSGLSGQGSGSANSGAATGSAANGEVGDGNFNPVRVNLEAVIDISGEVKIFAVPSTTLYNVVVCSNQLAATTLFDASSGVFELTEPLDSRGDISGFVSSAGRANGSVLNGIASHPIAALGTGLQGVLTGSLDASAANPFAKYAGQGNANNEYTTYASLGELVLSLYASYLFGHPAATAAISNDVALKNHIDGTTASDARAGQSLANAINNLTNAEATNIARAVISQDPNRAVNAPNRQFNAVNNEHHIPLIFRPGDVVYVSITVQSPDVAKSNGEALIGVAANISSSYPSPSPRFAFEITLS
jgi:hypothetical protein